MFKKFVLFISIFVINVSTNSQNFNFQRIWATYFGDESMCLVGNDPSIDVRSTCSALDSQGNFYIAGAITMNNQSFYNFSTSGAHQNTFGGGSSDGFLAKFNPVGNLLWATYFGGENADSIFGLTIDNQDKLYIMGYTESSQNIATSGSYQPNLLGTVNSFISKLDANGIVIWSTYYGDSNSDLYYNSFAQSLTCDNAGSLYLLNSTNSDGMATSGTFQTVRNGSKYLISKFSDTGNRIWSTYYGINDGRISSIKLNNNGLYVLGNSSDCPPNISNSYYATINFLNTQPAICKAGFMSKFSFDGQRIWSRYFANSTVNFFADRSFEVFGNSIYISAQTVSTTGIATVGAFQETKGNPLANFLVKYDDDGNKIWGTYYGINNDTNGSIDIACLTFCKADAVGNIYLFGSTLATQNIASFGSFQEIKSMNSDGFLAKFDPSGQRLWGTYYGGVGTERIWSTDFFGSNFYIVGSTSTTANMTTSNAYQSNFLDHNAFSVPLNIFITKFEPLPLGNALFDKEKLQLFPNPSNGNFTIKGDLSNNANNIKMNVYDQLGRMIYQSELNVIQNAVNQNFSYPLSSGIYFVKLDIENNNTKTFKIIIL